MIQPFHNLPLLSVCDMFLICVIFLLVLYLINQHFQGKRSSSDEGSSGKNEIPSICLFQEELEGEDFIFRTNIDENS
jgi:hypothetical protein